jgi:hypothetical protein
VINARFCDDFSLRHELNIAVRKSDSGLGGIDVGLSEFPACISYAYIDGSTGRDFCLALSLPRNTSRLEVIRKRLQEKRGGEKKKAKEVEGERDEESLAEGGQRRR